MATTLESISHYKENDILIWRKEGVRSFSYGNREYKTISEARAVIDSIADDVPDWDGADDYI